MIFRRVDDTTIRCMVTREDLEEYDITFEDFFKDVQKSRSFIQVIVEKAKEEADLEVHGDALSVQVMVIPPDSIAITLSEDTGFPDFSKLAGGLKDIAGELAELGITEDKFDEQSDKGNGALFEKFLEKLDSMMKPEEENRIIKKTESGTDKKSDKKAAKNSAKKKPSAGGNILRVFRFDDLHAVEAFSAFIYSGKNIKSALYREPHGGACFLILEKGRLGADMFNSICDKAHDFAGSEGASEVRAAYIKEHCSCLIKEKAVEKLASMA